MKNFILLFWHEVTVGRRILFISNLYPNPIYPNMAAYNRQQIEALREYCEVEVISPIPWPVLLKHRLKQSFREKKSIVVHHPTYYYTPRILRGWYGEYFYYSIKRVATQLLEKKQFDLIFSSWLYPDSWAAAKLAREFNLPFYVKVHGTDVNRLMPETTITRKSLEVINQSNKVICVSKALKEKLTCLGANDNKLEVLYNGIDRSIFYQMDRGEVRKFLDIDSDEFLVLFVGNLIKDKGLEELITAFKFIIDKKTIRSRLVIIGSGKYCATAQQLAVSLDICANVHFLGSQSQEIISLWMNAASVLCLPSYMEGVPNVVLEALSCGTPVVATNVGGIPELDRGQGNLRLVAPRSVSELRDAFNDVLLNDVVSAQSDFIYSWQENAARILNIFERSSS